MTSRSGHQMPRQFDSFCHWRVNPLKSNATYKKNYEELQEEQQFKHQDWWNVHSSVMFCGSMSSSKSNSYDLLLVRCSSCDRPGSLKPGQRRCPVPPCHGRGRVLEWASPQSILKRFCPLLLHVDVFAWEISSKIPKKILESWEGGSMPSCNLPFSTFGTTSGMNTCEAPKPWSIPKVEIFLRFSEIAVETKKRDVIQASGHRHLRISAQTDTKSLQTHKVSKVKQRSKMQKVPLLSVDCGPLVIGVKTILSTLTQ